MKTFEQGYTYGLLNVDNPQLRGQVIQFIKKEQNGKVPVTLENGTSVDEVLSVLLAKLKFENTKSPSRELSAAITNIQQGGFWLVQDGIERASKRVPEPKIEEGQTA